MIKLLERSTHRPGESGALDPFTIVKLDDHGLTVGTLDMNEDDLSHLYWLIEKRLNKQ